MKTIPIPFSGIPLPNKNNPILVIRAPYNFDIQFEIADNTEIPPYIKEMKEIVGFMPKKIPTIKGDLPQSVKYVKETEILANNIAKELAMSEDEKIEVLELVDEIAPYKSLIRGLRLSERLGSILYREGEEPIRVDMPLINVELRNRVELKPISAELVEPLVHLLGIIPVLMSREIKKELIRLENGLWYALYSLPIENEDRFKWIWDGRYACLFSVKCNN
ncbi:hypothetical protein HS7_08920 [Sulfolobales archaeon HS-7]|nr:hypothetical protein HS7_08920 [Sulfolobales archaeon HS-7]